MIDTSMFAVDLPAGSYAVGDVVELKNIAGPAVVRSGRGAAFLKNIASGTIFSGGAASYWKVKIENSDWIDPCENMTGCLGSTTSLDPLSGCNNYGHDCPLTPNSSWRITAECIEAATTTAANSIWTLIDIDYPAVASILAPDQLQGFPTAIEHKLTGAKMNAQGTLTTATWEIQSVDYLKAGYEYALDKVEMLVQGGGIGFVALSNAAGMAGLSRIIPTSGIVDAIKQEIKYASKVQKGPMDIKELLFATSGLAGTADTQIIFDYVKRRM